MKPTARILVTGNFVENDFSFIDNFLMWHTEIVKLLFKISFFYNSSQRDKLATDGSRPAPVGRVERGRSCDSPRVTANSGNRR